jgi:hypothetical protein
LQYVPFRDSPNDNPEAELSLEPGDYVLVQGEIDEDLFYEGRLFDGTAGLVPSNYVERVDEHELYANLSRSSTLANKAMAGPVSVSTSMGPAPSNRLPKPLGATAVSGWPRRVPLTEHVQMRRSIPANPQPADLLGPLPEYPSVFAQSSFLAQQPAHHMNLPSDFSTYPDVGQGHPPLPDSVCPYPPVDVSKVTVQEVKQMDGVRGRCAVVDLGLGLGLGLGTWGVQGVRNVPRSAWVKTHAATKTANATSVFTHAL